MKFDVFLLNPKPFSSRAHLSTFDLTPFCNNSYGDRYVLLWVLSGDEI